MAKSTISMENHHFSWLNQLFLWAIYTNQPCFVAFPPSSKIEIQRLTTISKEGSLVHVTSTPSPHFPRGGKLEFWGDGGKPKKGWRNHHGQESTILHKLAISCKNIWCIYNIYIYKYTKVQVDSLAVKPNHPKLYDFSGASVHGLFRTERGNPDDLHDLGGISKDLELLGQRRFWVQIFVGEFTVDYCRLL